jgi:hypothetical protein
MGRGAEIPPATLKGVGLLPPGWDGEVLLKVKVAPSDGGSWRLIV